MAKFPDKWALGPGPNLQSSRRLPPVDLTGGLVADAGQALGTLGEKVGKVFEKRENDAEAFDAESRFIDFQDQWRKALVDRQKAAPPGAAGFTDGVQQDYLIGAGAFFKSLPKRLQPEYDAKLRAFEGNVTTAADRFQTEEGRRFAVGQIDDATDKIGREVYEARTPEAVATAIAKHDALVDANPRLTAPEKEEIKRKNRQKLLAAGVTGQIDGDPDTARSWSESGYNEKVNRQESPDGRDNMAGSGAFGRYQFMPGTAYSLAQQTAWGRGLTQEQVIAAVKDDPKKEDELLGIYNARSNAALKAAGVPITDGNRFILHRFGQLGGVSLLNADSEMKVGDWVRSVNWGRGVSPEAVIRQNNLKPDMTVGELRQSTISEMAPGAKPRGARGTVAPSPTDAPDTAGTPPAPPPRRLIAPEGMSLDTALKMRTYAEHRVTQLKSDADEAARTTEQRVLLGQSDPSELSGIAANYRRLGLNSQATYFDYLASKPDLIRQWSAAGTDEQRAILLRAKDPLASAAEVAGTEKKRIAAELVKSGTERLTTAEADLKAGQPLDQVMPRLQEIYAIAKGAQNAELAGKVEKLATEHNALEGMRSMTPGQQETFLANARNQLARDGGQPGQYAIVGRLEKDYQDFQSDLAKDPWSAGSKRYSLAVQPMPAIGQGTPQTIDGLQTRAAQASAILSKVPEAAGKLVPFSSEEMAAIGAAFDKAPANVKVQMLGTLSAGLGPQWFAATMKHLSEKGHGALAWAGGLMSTDPSAARTIIEGADVKKLKDKIVPSGSDLTTAVDEAVGTTFRDPAARAMVNDAIHAAYAKIAFDAGKTDGKYDQDIADKAMKLVLGNVVTDQKGQRLIPPRRDMTGADWRDLKDRIQDSDLPELRTMEGDRIDAVRIKQFGVFSSAGDGQYLVRMPDRGGVLHEIPDPARPGQAWVIDMRPLLARAPLSPVRQPDEVIRHPTPPAVQPLLPETRKRGAPGPSDAVRIPLPTLAPPMAQPDDGPSGVPEGYGQDILRAPPPRPGRR